MAQDQSTFLRVREKPEKPYDGFPLSAHSSGNWLKKQQERTDDLLRALVITSTSDNTGAHDRVRRTVHS